MSNGLSWLEKYRPTNLNDYLAYNKFKVIIEEYIVPIKKYKITYKPFLILYGDPGVGKTSLAHCIYDEYNYDKIECNASETRTKRVLSELINTGVNSVIVGNDGLLKKPGLIMDEVDGITTGECNGIKTLLDYTILKRINKGEADFKDYQYTTNIKKGQYQYKVRYPVICTTNSIKDKKIKPLLDLGILVRVCHPSQISLLTLAKKINTLEHLDLTTILLNNIISVCKPDYRSLIIFLNEISLFKYTILSNLNNNKSIVKCNNVEYNITNISKKEYRILLYNYVSNKITTFELNNQLSHYVNLPIHNLVSNLITHYPIYLKYTYKMLNDMDHNTIILNNKSDISNIIKYKTKYLDELSSLIQLDTNLLYYNILENMPKIIGDISNSKLLIINKDKTITTRIKKERILYTIKCSLNLLYMYNNIMKLYNNWRNYIEIYKNWDLQDYGNELLVFIINVVNQFNYNFGKSNKGIQILDTNYHTKYNNMKQYLGLLNNQIIFYYSDIKKTISLHTNKTNTNKTNTNKTNTKGNLDRRLYFNIEQHLITYNIDIFYMYYQMGDILPEIYDTHYNVCINKINTILKEIS